jgi:hypothetical protein
MSLNRPAKWLIVCLCAASLGWVLSREGKIKAQGHQRHISTPLFFTFLGIHPEFLQILRHFLGSRDTLTTFPEKVV